MLQKSLEAPSGDDSPLELKRLQLSPEHQEQFIRAFLSEVQGKQENDLYRLDFRLVDSNSKRLATFLLEKSSESLC